MNEPRDASSKLEHYGEKAIFASRWLLAPFYIGLALSIVVLLVKFMAELFISFCTPSPRPRAR